MSSNRHYLDDVSILCLHMIIETPDDNTRKKTESTRLIPQNKNLSNHIRASV